MPAPLLACPVCAQPLTRDGAAFRCVSGHAYDVARSGYVNLLLANQRRSKDPGDDKAMMAARTAFLEAGWYGPLGDALAQAVLADPTAARVVDVGCGEGWYLRRLRQRAAARPLDLHGLDISRHAVEAAARRDPASLYAVAGAHRLPILTGAADALISNFAPLETGEAHRVLREAGRLVVGAPGPRHLFGLRTLIYETPTEHPEVPPLTAGFALLAETRVRRDLQLRDAATIAALIGMTPYAWAADARDRLAGLAELDTELDVVIRTYERLS
ncbi:putative RNA methyltransferase [Phenylobacterium sp.]|uniref:putative RNA methyltransferase n=1 Tax=Phenylobacterium sp. TaxID=1871053 RepID=UPI0027340317|nr:methyltransferase domain-containing protein [Phenylobacterium sp.]MDP3853106.1 methyltransferase domain-containing protein [Phenylobacterium sp.]